MNTPEEIGVALKLAKKGASLGQIEAALFAVSPTVPAAEMRDLGKFALASVTAGRIIGALPVGTPIPADLVPRLPGSTGYLTIVSVTLDFGGQLANQRYRNAHLDFSWSVSKAEIEQAILDQVKQWKSDQRYNAVPLDTDPTVQYGPIYQR